MNIPPSARSQTELIQELQLLREEILRLLAQKTTLQINRIGTLCERILGLIEDLPHLESILEWSEVRRELLCKFALRMLELNTKPGDMNLNIDIIQQYSQIVGHEPPHPSTAPQHGDDDQQQQAQRDAEADSRLESLRAELNDVSCLVHQLHQELAQERNKQQSQPSSPSTSTSGRGRGRSRSRSHKNVADSSSQSIRYFYTGRTIAPIESPQTDLPQVLPSSTTATPPTISSVAYQTRTRERFRKDFNQLGPISESTGGETLRSITDLLNRGHLDATTYRRECPGLEHDLLNIALLALTPWLKTRIGETAATHIYSLYSLYKIVYDEFIQANQGRAEYSEPSHGSSQSPGF